MTGRWDIVEMDEFDEDYFDLGEEKPYLTITQFGDGRRARRVRNRTFNGQPRWRTAPFGDETIFIFGYAGMDEMDPVDGAGWIRLTGPDTLEGEFLGVLGRFQARRKAPKRARPASSDTDGDLIRTQRPMAVTRSLEEINRLLAEAQAQSAELTARQAELLSQIRELQQERAALLPTARNRATRCSTPPVGQ